MGAEIDSRRGGLC